MPHYVYRCPKCAKEFEVKKSMADVLRPESCPACKEPGTRVFTPPALTGQSVSAFSESEAPGGCASCCSGGTCGLN